MGEDGQKAKGVVSYTSECDPEWPESPRRMPARPIPVLVKKTDKIIENRFNYRLTLFSFTTFNWIYDSFYTDVKGGTVIKKIPLFIPEYLTAKGLAHLIMQAGSPYVLEQNTILINTKLANKSEINFIKKILLDKYNIESIVSSNYSNDNVNFNLIIKDLSFFNLTKIIAPHMPLEFSFLLHSDYLSSFVQNSKNLENKNISDLFEPIVIYNDLSTDINRKSIIKENVDKSGIYK